jgi:energy-coupling factor transporter transmembrane protein EcfT
MKNSKKVLIGLLNVVILLFSPVIITGLSIALLAGVICMLSGVDFHTIMNSGFMGVLFFIIWLCVTIYVGNNLFDNH